MFGVRRGSCVSWSLSWHLRVLDVEQPQCSTGDLCGRSLRRPGGGWDDAPDAGSAAWNYQRLSWLRRPCSS